MKRRTLLAGAALSATPALLTGCATAERPSGAAGFDPAPDREEPHPWTHERFATGREYVRFAVVGDRTGGSRDGVFIAGLEKLNWLRPELVVSVGDLIEGYTDRPGEAGAQWRELDGTLQRLAVPFFRTAGNHDMGNSTMLAQWRDRYGPPTTTSPTVAPSSSCCAPRTRRSRCRHGCGARSESSTACWQTTRRRHSVSSASGRANPRATATCTTRQWRSPNGRWTGPATCWTATATPPGRSSSCTSRPGSTTTPRSAASKTLWTVATTPSSPATTTTTGTPPAGNATTSGWARWAAAGTSRGQATSTTSRSSP